MYSLMIVVGAVSFLIYYKFRVERGEGVDRISSNRIIFTSILGFIVLGASAFIFNGIFHSIEKGAIAFGGITWLGGVIGAVPAMYYLIHVFVPKEKGNAVNRFSTMLPGLVLAHAFGRLGCFFGGCCFGGRTDSFLGVSFPAGSPAGKLYPDTSSTATKVVDVLNSAGEKIGEEILYPSLPVLPTQLIEAVFEIILFVVMMILYKKCKHYNFEIYAFVYGAFRFTLEFFRGDDRGATGIGITPSQFMCIILWVGAVLLILFRNRKVFKKLYAKCAVWRAEAVSAPAGAVNIPFVNSGKRTADSIRELHRLKEDGIITEEEFKEKKAELLKRM